MWLLDSLTAYIKLKATNYVNEDLVRIHVVTGESLASLRKACKKTIKDRRLSFIIGCAGRIKTRLKETAHAEIKVRAASGTALVTLDKHALATRELYSRYGIKLERAASHRINYGSQEALAAGQRAGDAATFGRPLQGNGARLLLK